MASKKRKKNRKIIPYRRPRADIGRLIFGVIFLYLLINIFIYMGHDKIQFYEVAEGSIVNDRPYTGLILREEQIYSAENSGYVNYYLREGKRASVGARIYSLDETGRLDSLLKENSEGEQSLSDENLSDLKKQLSSFVLARSDENFGAIYDARYALEAAVMEYSSFSALDQLDKIAKESGVVFEQVTSPQSGVVSYGFDSYESLKPEDVEMASFNRSSYTKNLRKSGDLIESGSPVYKIASSENWSIVFPLSEEDKNLYQDKSSLTVEFKDHSIETQAAFSVFTGKDGSSFGRLDFSKYMAQFITDRFVSFEIRQDQARGLKIPVSAVTEKNFYQIPKDYVTLGGDSTDNGVTKEVYDAGGTNAVFTPIDIGFSDDEFCYVAVSEDGPLKAGDYIVKPDSQERYQIGSTKALKGVYNINKGYTVFKEIEILDSNSEYYTIKQGSGYGLSVYEHIVMDASLVAEGQILYQ